MYNIILTATNQNLIKSKFPYINMFYHQLPAVVRTMCNLTAVVFEYLYIASLMDVYQTIWYTQLILRWTALNKYKHVFSGCK